MTWSKFNKGPSFHSKSSHLKHNDSEIFKQSDQIEFLLAS